MKYVYSVILISASLNGMDYGLAKEGVVARLEKEFGLSFKGLDVEEFPKWRKKIQVQKIVAIKSKQEGKPYYTIDVPLPTKKKIKKKQLLVCENANLYKPDKFEDLIKYLKKNFSGWQIYFICPRLADD